MAACSTRRAEFTAVRMALIAIAVSRMLSAGVNEWTSIGPEGGSVLRLAADPRNPATVYAGTCAGIFKTADGGSSWTAVNSGLPVPDCFGLIEIDPQTAGTVYVAGHQGVFKTTDGGTSWNAINFGGYLALNTTGCLYVCSQSFAIDPRNPAILYAAAGPLLKSMDGGATWMTVNSDSFNLVAVDPQNGTVYASGYAGLFKSTDGGASWNSVVLVQTGVITGLAIDPKASGTLYYWRSDRIFKSTDGGVNWSDISPVLPLPPGAGNYNHVQAFAGNPQNPALLQTLMFQTSHYSTIPDFYRMFTSTDGGASWSAATDSTLAASDLSTIAPDPQDPSTWYLGTSDGVLKSIDAGAHWSFNNSGLRAVPVSQVLIQPQDGTLFAVRSYAPNGGGAHSSGFFKSTDGGKSWTRSGQGLPLFFGALIPRSSDLRTLYTVGRYYPYYVQDQAVFKSEDAGESWTQIWAQPDSHMGVAIEGLGPLTINPQNPDIMYLGASGSCSSNCVNWIFKSTDAGRTWASSQPSQADGSAFSSLAVDPQDPNTIYGGTYSVGGWTDTSLWKSVDQGSHWTKLSGGAADVNTIKIDALDPTTVYFADGAVHKSTDGGQTWTGILPGGYDLLVMDPQNSKTLYAASSWYFNWTSPIGLPVMRSTDAGANWTALSPVSNRINSISIDPRDSNTLYAATAGGLFAITFGPQRQ